MTSRLRVLESANERDRDVAVLEERRLTIELLKHALNCARAAAAAHSDIKLVVVLGHCVFM